jgi:succinate dehydrogenase / fumarate reductase iron-sulfur subunit
LTVLDGLWRIKEDQDASLAWRASCRMGVCGSCGMMINGRPGLACNTQISELGSTTVAVAPLPNFDILRDLVPDLRTLFDAHGALFPYLLREDEEEQEHPTVEYWQSVEEMERYLQFSYCIKCGSCVAACPTCATDPVYSGPMALGQAHRYNSDTRDGGFEVRKEILAGEKGPWRCHFAGECSRVCPKGVDPAKAIQLMRRQLVLDYLRLRRKCQPASLVEKPEGIERRPDIPEAPPPTVGGE